MAVLTAGYSYPINMNTFDPTAFYFGTNTYASSTRYRVNDSSTVYADFLGNFYYDSRGNLVAGEIDSIQEFRSGYSAVRISSLAMDVETYLDFAYAGDSAGAKAYMFELADTMYGSNYGDVLNGYDDNDTLYGNGGDDTLNGGYGNDVLSGGVGNDWMYGGYGNDTYYVSSSADRVYEYSGLGVDKVIASVSYTLATGSYVETLSAAAGTASINLYGNAYANTLNGNSGANILSAGGGNDRLYGLAGADDLYGSLGNDILSGGTGGDYLSGGSGNDNLDGGLDGDDLYGGTGRDLLFGGDGADYFIYSALSDSTVALSGRDVIEDFDADEGDWIDLRDIDARDYTASDDAFTFRDSLPFSGNGFGGELRAVKYQGYSVVSGDVDGDGYADFSIEVAGTDTVTDDYFLL